MSSAGRWVRARVIAVMLWALFVVGFTILPMGAMFLLGRFGGSRPGADLLLGDGQAFLIAAGPGGPFHGSVPNGLVPSEPKTGGGHGFPDRTVKGILDSPGRVPHLRS